MDLSCFQKLDVKILHIECAVGASRHKVIELVDSAAEIISFYCGLREKIARKDLETLLLAVVRYCGEHER